MMLHRKNLFPEYICFLQELPRTVMLAALCVINDSGCVTTENLPKLYFAVQIENILRCLESRVIIGFQ